MFVASQQRTKFYVPNGVHEVRAKRLEFESADLVMSNDIFGALEMTFQLIATRLAWNVLADAFVKCDFHE